MEIKKKKKFKIPGTFYNYKGEKNSGISALDVDAEVPSLRDFVLKYVKFNGALPVADLSDDGSDNEKIEIQDLDLDSMSMDEKLDLYNELSEDIELFKSQQADNSTSFEAKQQKQETVELNANTEIEKVQTEEEKKS